MPSNNKVLNGDGLAHLTEKIKEYVDEHGGTEEVYIGTTEPTGSEKIWINPNGEESPIVTKDYVDSEIERVEGEIPSLDGYATENYVDSEIERVEGEIPEELIPGTGISIVDGVISVSFSRAEEGRF